MFLTITTTGSPDATDLGFLLHKHPDRVQRFDLAVGRAHVFYPEATPARCTAALLLEVDPVGIVRNKRFGGGDAFALAQYVNDRPYAASSMLAVALGKAFATARAGTCAARPDLPGRPMPLEIHVPALPCRGGADAARRFLEPLGWEVGAAPVPLDPTIPEWGDSRYVDLRLTGTLRLADALNQLYVLLPVLDDAKHYWVAADEVDKLVRVGGGWLADHPAREEITARYLAHRRRYVTDAVARLDALDEVDAAGEHPGPDGEGTAETTPAPVPARVPLARLRSDAVLGALAESGASTVLDLGCGEGALLRRLVTDRRWTRIVGADVSARALERAERAVGLRDASNAERERVRLLQSSLTYADERLTGFDSAVLMEVIEHVEPSRHDALERAVWGVAAPRVVVVTTPNAEFNVHYANLLRSTGEPGSGVRHPDHRFEWTRAQFEDWATGVALRYGYDVEFRPVGDPTPPARSSTRVPDAAADDTAPMPPDVGTPTQMAVFTRRVEPHGATPDENGTRP